jgi:predicted TPR repeat methyltransferase
LQYQVPYLLAERLPVQPGRKLLDLGCGTGLLGEALVEHGYDLTGVDLSGNMLARAQTRGRYTQLEQISIEYFCAKAEPESYDAVIAADVFIYVGRLEAIFSQIFPLLKTGADFYFSTETYSGAEALMLHSHARYAHRDDYVLAVAANAGLTLISNEAITVRYETGQPVAGHLYHFNKT